MKELLDELKATRAEMVDAETILCDTLTKAALRGRLIMRLGDEPEWRPFETARNKFEMASRTLADYLISEEKKP